MVLSQALNRIFVKLLHIISFQSLIKLSIEFKTVPSQNNNKFMFPNSPLRDRKQTPVILYYSDLHVAVTNSGTLATFYR